MPRERRDARICAAAQRYARAVDDHDRDVSGVLSQRCFRHRAAVGVRADGVGESALELVRRGCDGAPPRDDALEGDRRAEHLGRSREVVVVEAPQAAAAGARRDRAARGLRAATTPRCGRCPGVFTMNAGFAPSAATWTNDDPPPSRGSMLRMYPTPTRAGEPAGCMTLSIPRRSSAAAGARAAAGGSSLTIVTQLLAAARRLALLDMHESKVPGERVTHVPRYPGLMGGVWRCADKRTARQERGATPELVADAAHREDARRPNGVALDLAPDVRDVRVGRALVAEERRAPEVLHDRGAREHLAGRLGEQQQELELGARQPDLARRRTSTVRPERIDLEPGDREADAGLDRRRRGAGAAAARRPGS